MARSRGWQTEAVRDALSQLGGNDGTEVKVYLKGRELLLRYNCSRRAPKAYRFIGTVRRTGADWT